ncbi:hypothetical protein OWV82_026646 [Melia azedarach]|nr:hypothetical protein OWV82_026646 [Melia azedarach]
MPRNVISAQCSEYVKVKKFNQARVNGGSNYDSLKRGTAPLFGPKARLGGPIRAEDIVRWGVWLGAAHSVKDNAGVLRLAQREQKSRVEQKGKSSFDSDFQYRIRTVKAWPIDPLDLRNLKLEVVRKVTTGITGLWQPSVHSDVAF